MKAKRVYLIERYITLSDSAYVEATNKTEAVKKALNNDFVEVKSMSYDGNAGWVTGTPERVTKPKAHLTNETVRQPEE